jgi:hypothetical protein
MLCVAGLVHATDIQCDTTIKPDIQFGYGKRDATRCEGFFIAPTSGSLELVSLIHGRLAFELSSNTRLEIRTWKTVPANVRAVALPLRAYYRMDALIDSSEGLAWPLADVVAPAHLSDERLGIFAWTSDGRGKVYLPIEVRDTRKLWPQQPEPVTLTLRSDIDLESIKWRHGLEQKDRCGTPGDWQNAFSNGPRKAGQRIDIPISNLGSGEFCVEAFGKPRNSDQWVPLRFRLRLP